MFEDLRQSICQAFYDQKRAADIRITGMGARALSWDQNIKLTAGIASIYDYTNSTQCVKEHINGSYGQF